MTNTDDIISRMIAKASQSPLNYRVAALALDKKGKPIGLTCNQPRYDLSNNTHGYRNSFHAEELVIRSLNPLQIGKVLILRVGKGGNILPIDPCSQCLKLANKYGIKIERMEIT